MPRYRVSAISHVAISAVATVRASSEQEAIDQAKILHRDAQLVWMNGQTRAGAFTGEVENIWAEEASPGSWKVSLLALMPIAKDATFDADTKKQAEDRAAKDYPYTPVDDWEYQQRPMSPLGGVRDPIEWASEVSVPSPPTYVPPTITTLEIIPNSALSGATIVLNAIIESDHGMPDGTVTFYEVIGGVNTSVGSATVTNDQAVIKIIAGSPGVHTYIASYSGSSGFLASESSPATLDVTGVNRTVTISLSYIENTSGLPGNPHIWDTDTNPSLLDHVIATLSGSGTITGTVQFFWDGGYGPVSYNQATGLPAIIPIVGNQADIYTTPSDGTHDQPGVWTVIANYSGDANHDPATITDTLNVWVRTLIQNFSYSSPPSSWDGVSPITLTARIFDQPVNGYAVKQGTAEFFINNVSIGVVNLSTGTLDPINQRYVDVSKSWTPPGVGSYTLRVDFSGNTSHAPCTGTTSFNVSTSISTLREPTSILYDGTSLWTTDKANGKINKINPTGTPAVTNVIDLTGSGITATRSSVASSGKLFVTGMDSGMVAAIDTTTNAIVGLGRTNVSSGPFYSKAICCAVDGSNKLWVGYQHISDSGGVVHTFDIPTMLSSYPSVVAPTNTYRYGPYLASGGASVYARFETLQFAGGYIWAGTGAFVTYGRVYRIDPATGSAIYYENSLVTGFDHQYSALFAHSSVWTTGFNNTAPKRVYRYDPSVFPSDPIVIDIISYMDWPAHMAADATSIWVTRVGFSNAQPSGPLYDVLRIDATSNTVIETYRAPLGVHGLQGITVDGSGKVWVTTRNNTSVYQGVFRITPGVGFDYQISG